MIRLVLRTCIIIALFIVTLRAIEPRGGMITDGFNAATSNAQDYCTNTFEICKPIAMISSHAWQSANIAYDLVAGNGKLVYVPDTKRHPSTEPAHHEPSATDPIASTLQSLGLGPVRATNERNSAASYDDSVYPLR